MIISFGLIFFFLISCSDPKKASKTNFEKSVHEQLAASE